MGTQNSALAAIVSDEGDAGRQHAIEARAYFQRRWLVVRLDSDDLPAFVRQWLLNRGRERFERGAKA